MKSWPDQRALQLLGIETPIIQAPMAGVDTPALAAAVSNAGGLGSLACALLSPDQIRTAWAAMQAETDKPLNLNFFCHEQNDKSLTQQERWKAKLSPYYAEFGINPDTIPPSATRAPFDENFCNLIEELKPPVVSFHFGLPSDDLLERVKRTGAAILSSATTIEEALWLEQKGCDAIIAQGADAGGHRAMFLNHEIATQMDTVDLLPLIMKVVTVPVIAAGGIANARGIKSALALGAAAVQLGTAYLFCPEARVSPLYREALESDGATVLTNVFSGRPARGIVNRFINEIGPISADAPDFPYASHLVMPLRNASEKSGSHDFMQMWSGKIRIAHDMNARDLTIKLSEDTLGIL